MTTLPPWITLNNALDYRTNRLYRTHNPNPNFNRKKRNPLAREPDKDNRF